MGVWGRSRNKTIQRWPAIEEAITGVANIVVAQTGVNSVNTSQLIEKLEEYKAVFGFPVKFGLPRGPTPVTNIRIHGSYYFAEGFWNILATAELERAAFAQYTGPATSNTDKSPDGRGTLDVTLPSGCDHDIYIECTTP